MNPVRTALLRITAILLAVFVLSGLCSAPLQISYAASVSAAAKRPVITSSAVNENTVTVRWSKVKNAGKYKVYVRTGPNKWKYIKRIKKTSANKRKYSNAVNYKIVAAGKKYKLYKRSNPFRMKATVKKRSYSFKGEYGASYAFIIKPYTGKKAGLKSTIKTVKIPEPEPEPEQEPEPVPTEDLSKPDRANVDAVRAYADKLYSENMTPDRDYLAGGFTWDQEFARSKASNPDARTHGWKYYNVLMLEAFMSEDTDNTAEILRFYDSHFSQDGKLLIAHNTLYSGSALDLVMPAAPMVELVITGAANEEQAADYNRAANTVYNKLENQYMYDGEDGRPYAGKLWMHHQANDPETGEIAPVSSWSKWPVCLDGIYMSHLFLIRLAEAIDSGKMEITSVDGHVVSSEELWKDIYTRLSFAAERFRVQETGLLSHVYSPERYETNNISWGRGAGWFMMVMLEAIENMPDGQERRTLQQQYENLMRSVLEWQDPDSHIWYNIMTRKDDLAKNRPETSGSAMLSYCLLRGYAGGILKDEEFRSAGLTAFNAIVKYHYDEETGLTDTLIAMGPGNTEGAYNNPQYVSNEAKGIAPLIMAAEYVMP